MKRNRVLNAAARFLRTLLVSSAAPAPFGEERAYERPEPCNVPSITIFYHYGYTDRDTARRRAN
jgi:hypothetical protein